MTDLHPPTGRERERRRPCGCPFRWHIDGNVIRLTQSEHHMSACPDFPEIRAVPFDVPHGGAS